MRHSVHLAQLSEFVEELTNITRSVTQALEDANAASHRLHGTWDGEASDAHTLAHTAWADDSREMAEALAGMRRLLDGARANYDAAVDANSRMWG